MDFNYKPLAEFRYEFLRFQILSERAARATGIEPQQFQALLAIKGLPDGRKATIGLLAERLQIQPHSAVELVDRMESSRLLKRVPSRADRREVLLQVTRHGEKFLKRVALPHRAELRLRGRRLLRALRQVMAQIGRNGNAGPRLVRENPKNRLAKRLK